MKTTGVKDVPKKILLVFLGYPIVECRTGISSIRLDHDIQGKVLKGSMFKGGVGRTLANKSYAGVVGEAFPGRDVRSQP